MKTTLNIILFVLLAAQVACIGSICVIALLSIKFTIGLLVALNFRWLVAPIK